MVATVLTADGVAMASVMPRPIRQSTNWLKVCARPWNMAAMLQVNTPRTLAHLTPILSTRGPEISSATAIDPWNQAPRVP